MLEAVLGQSPPSPTCSQDPHLSANPPWVHAPGKDLETHTHGDKALGFAKGNDGNTTGREDDHGLCLKTLMSFLFCWLLSWASTMKSNFHICFDG